MGLKHLIGDQILRALGLTEETRLRLVERRLASGSELHL